jgi:DNA-directed RNA polymerase subunit E"
MAKLPFACGECNLVLEDGIDQCPRCPTAPVSTDWLGLVVILEPDRSAVARRLGVVIPGNYALKVNIR